MTDAAVNEKSEKDDSIELEFLRLYMSLDMFGRMAVGHQLNNFIKSCSFGGLECNIDNGYSFNNITSFVSISSFPIYCLNK